MDEINKEVNNKVIKTLTVNNIPRASISKNVSEVEEKESHSSSIEKFIKKMPFTIKIH